jgi:hypothetical protein
LASLCQVTVPNFPAAGDPTAGHYRHQHLLIVQQNIQWASGLISAAARAPPPLRRTLSAVLPCGINCILRLGPARRNTEEGDSRDTTETCCSDYY